MRTADGYIVRKCLEGDPAAFGLLVERYKEGVYALAYSKLQNFHDAEDVTQEVFIKAYRSLRTLRQWESFHAWIYSITSNLCKDWLRAQSRRPDREFIADQNPVSTENHRPENPVLDFLHEALDSLPKTYRQVLTLYYLSDMNTREIAEFLGMSPSAVRQRLSRARSQLKEETLAMMSAAYEGQRLPAGFTFRIVEAVKRIKIQPAPRITSVPWGVSLATGIVIAVLTLGPHLSLPSFNSAFMESSPSNEAVSVEPGQMPVELLKAPQMPFTSGMQGNDGSSSSRPSGQQNAFVMAPRGEGITIPEEPSARLGKGNAGSVGYSPDGKFLLVYSSIGVWLHNAANPDEGWLMDQSSIVFSPDGRTFASFSPGSDQIPLWDANERRQIGVLKGHTDKVYHVAFSPDGQLLASGSYDKTARLWNVGEQKQVGILRGHKGYVDYVIFSADGRQLISCSFSEDDRTIRLWDVQSQNQLGVLELNADMGVAAFSPDRKIWALYKDETIQLWDIQRQELLGELQGQPGDIYSVAFSPDGKIVASSGLDETIRLWDVRECNQIGELLGHTQPKIYSVRFSPDGKILASSGADATIRLWDVQAQKQVGVLKGRAGYGDSIAFSPDNKTLASADRWDGVVRIWNFQEQKQVGLLEGYGNDIFSLAFSPGGKILAFGYINGIVDLWDVQSQKQLGVLKGHTDQVHRVAFSPDGEILASGSMDRTVRLWDVQTQKEIGVLQNGSYAHCVAFSPDGKTLASACGQQGQVRLWDVDTQKQIDVLQYERAVQAVAFSPDGKILASGNTGGVIPLWDVEGQEHIGELKGHTDMIWTVTFSPDGKLLASASGDRTVCLWDVHKQKRIAILRGHTKSLHSVAFSPDGKYLASSDDGGMIILWDAESHEQLSVVQKEGRPVWGVAFSPDGKWLASGEWGNVVLLWEVNIPIQGKSVGSTGKLPGIWGEVKRTALLQNFPNPFNPETWIPFSLSEPQHVTIRIYNSAGQIVRTLDLGYRPPGEYLSKDKAAYWDGTNEKGEKAASDVYFYVMDAGVTDLRKMVMVR